MNAPTPRTVHKMRAPGDATRSVVVIGAGAAGLACASTLLANNVAVTLLEATQRIGGRCRTESNFGGHGPCELGATWVHGVQGNPLFAMCSELNLLPISTRSQKPPLPLHLSFDQQQVDGKMVRDVNRVLRTAVSEVEDGTAWPEPVSLGEHVRDAWARARAHLLDRHGGTESAELIDAAWRAAEKHQCAIDGCGDLSEESAGRAFAQFDDYDGRDVPSRPDLGGFSAAMEALAAPLRASGDLRLGCAVEAVDWHDGWATVVCEDGNRLTADAACVTVPLKPLRSSLRFTPPLPAANRAGLDAIALGQVEKLFVLFEHPETGAEVVPPLPTLHLLWAGVGDGPPPPLESGGWVRCMHSLHRARYDGTGPPALREAHGGTSSEASDDGGAFGGDSSSGGGLRRQSLVGWLTGESAAAVSGRGTEELLPELLNGLGPFLDQLDGWRPVACHATAWAADPRYGGSYSFPRARAPADAAVQLASPLTTPDGCPLVCFAGEATSVAGFGTVAGALESGQREAERLLRAWGLQKV